MAKLYLAIILLCITVRSAAQKKIFDGSMDEIYGSVARIILTDSVVNEPSYELCVGYGITQPKEYDSTTHILDDKGNQVVLQLL